MIKPFPKDMICTSDIRIVSDGDNSYHLWSSGIDEFNKDCEYIQNLKESSDEWFQACDDFDTKYGQYQI